MSVADLVEAEPTTRVVQIDDEPTETTLPATYWARLGAHVHVVQSLSDARPTLRRLAATQRDQLIILLDLMFPSNPEDGLKLLEEIRTGQLDIAPDTPVIVYTAAGDPAVKESAMRLGANEFVVKGTDPARLRRALEVWAGRETRVATTLAEVIDVDFINEQVRVRIRGSEDWVAERNFAFQLCPTQARFSGAAFLLETYERRQGQSKELVLRAKTVDAIEEQIVISKLLAIPDEA